MNNSRPDSGFTKTLNRVLYQRSEMIASQKPTDYRRRDVPPTPQRVPDNHRRQYRKVNSGFSNLSYVGHEEVLERPFAYTPSYLPSTDSVFQGKEDGTENTAHHVLPARTQRSWDVNLTAGPSVATQEPDIHCIASYPQHLPFEERQMVLEQLYPGSRSPIVEGQVHLAAPNRGSWSSSSRSNGPSTPLIESKSPELLLALHTSRTLTSSSDTLNRPPQSHSFSSGQKYQVDNKSVQSCDSTQEVSDDKVFASNEPNTNKKPYDQSRTRLEQRHDLDLHIAFDFYTQNPLDVPHSPSYMSGAGDSQSPYMDLLQATKQNDQFLEGMLLRSVRSDALFPFVNYVVFKSAPGSARRIKTPTPSSQAGRTFPTTQVEGESNLLSPRVESDRSKSSNDNLEFIEMISSQGGYKEAFTFIDRGLPILPKKAASLNTVYLISAFKTLESQDTRELDESWSVWSGADFIVENIPPILSLQRLTFHKVKYNLDKETFRYVLMCELTEGLTKLSRTLSFVELLRLRQCGYSNVYVPLQHF